jgi:hypothetical protein
VILRLRNEWAFEEREDMVLGTLGLDVSTCDGREGLVIPIVGEEQIPLGLFETPTMDYTEPRVNAIDADLAGAKLDDRAMFFMGSGYSFNFSTLESDPKDP